MRAIKTKISSVTNINQITKALEVVSTVKLKKVKEQTDSYRVFMNELIAMLHRLGQYVNIFDNVVVKSDKTLVIVMGTEKGLCGSLNAKINKMVDMTFSTSKDLVDIYAVGKKAVEFFVREGYTIAGSLSIPDMFDTSDVVELYNYIHESLDAGRYARVVIAFNYFHNALVQEPVFLDLFPLEEGAFDSFVESMGVDMTERLSQVEVTDIELEPSVGEVSTYLQALVIKYMVFGALLQNKTGEFASRMIAMKNAKDNSKDLIKKLNITFNKARQAAVTQEISEIVSAKVSMES
ncbi:MAG: ATP synthase F1 subunit gamma [Candidatus Peribacteria bacterium]|nr:MAG: ATP synthase F1 subunit gamma [Candidatus Peribacteria bacterium]